MSDIEIRNVSSAKTLPAIAWASLVVGFWPVGLIIAFLERGKCSDIEATHYRYLVRTCLIGMLFFFVSSLLMLILIGFPMMAVSAIWYLARCVKAMIALHRGEPISNPGTWLV